MTTIDEQAFERACWAAVGECRTFGYDPTAWIDMMQRHGAADAARRLLVSGTVQPGFERLVRERRADLTVEYAVLRPEWRGLFDRREREAARWRLSQAGVTELPDE